MKKEIKVSDIPDEVWHVKAIQFSKQPVGLATLNRVKEVIAKYPEYFTWEHKYESLPKEVHEAFEKEAYPKKLEWIPKEVNCNEGFLAQIEKRVTYNPQSFTAKDLTDFMENIKNEVNLKWEHERKITAIWDKHYKKYGLEFREF